VVKLKFEVSDAGSMQRLAIRSRLDQGQRWRFAAGWFEIGPSWLDVGLRWIDGAVLSEVMSGELKLGRRTKMDRGWIEVGSRLDRGWVRARSKSDPNTDTMCWCGKNGMFDYDHERSDRSEREASGNSKHSS
jgi:hypothetical protein